MIQGDGFLVVKEVSQITEPRMPPIFLGNDDRTSRDRPIDPQIGIAPKNAGVVGWAVIASDFVKNLGVVFEGAEAMQKAGWNP